MRIAVIGSGISGIAWAASLQRQGHELVVYERDVQLGGVWAAAYPDVRLQNFGAHYHLADFPWPFQPDQHPTAAQILRYLELAVERFELDVRLEHEVVALREREGGWDVEVRGVGGTSVEWFDYVVVAVGQYTQPKAELAIAERERFGGEVLTEREIHDLDVLAGKRVAVVGFGKSAVDLAAFAVARGSKVEHVFRTPRWLIPLYFANRIHATRIVLARFGTVMISCWAHPTAGARFLHGRMDWFIRGFWSTMTRVLGMQLRAHARGLGPDARERLRVLEPEHTLLSDMRSAAALAPDDYYPAVARGDIRPHRGVVQRFGERGLVLEDGREIEADLVVLCLGSGSPVFPFMPAPYRELLEREHDGVQLYRHILHPRIPNLAFAGYNHGFMHVPASEVAALWVGAMLRGELLLPSVEEMEAAIEHVRAWKRANINFEPSRSCAVNTRFHQYLDIVLEELGLSPRRKRNFLAEQFERYEASDYANLLEEYQAAWAANPTPRRPSKLPT